VGDPQRLSDNEQLEILALLEAVSTDRSAMRAARALAELMGHLHGLGQRVAAELSDQDRDIKPARR
jgi:DNA repair protein RadC